MENNKNNEEGEEKSTHQAPHKQQDRTKEGPPEDTAWQRERPTKEEALPERTPPPPTTAGRSSFSERSPAGVAAPTARTPRRKTPPKEAPQQQSPREPVVEEKLPQAKTPRPLVQARVAPEEHSSIQARSPSENQSLSQEKSSSEVKPSSEKKSSSEVKSSSEEGQQSQEESSQANSSAAPKSPTQEDQVSHAKLSSESKSASEEGQSPVEKVCSQVKAQQKSSTDKELLTEVKLSAQVKPLPEAKSPSQPRPSTRPISEVTPSNTSPSSKASPSQEQTQHSSARSHPSEEAARRAHQEDTPITSTLQGEGYHSRRLQHRLHLAEETPAEEKPPPTQRKIPPDAAQDWEKIRGLKMGAIPESALFAAGRQWSNHDLGNFLQPMCEQTGCSYVNPLFLHTAQSNPQEALHMLKGQAGKIIIPLWIRNHWFLAAANMATATLEFADSEEAVTTPEEIKEIGQFIEFGLKCSLRMSMVRTFLQGRGTVTCGMHTAINAMLWAHNLLQQRRCPHKTRVVNMDALAPRIAMYVEGDLSLDKLLRSVLSHFATMEAPLLQHEDVVDLLDALSEKGVGFVRVGWIAYPGDCATLLEWEGEMQKRYPTKWRIAFTENEEPVWAPRQEISYMYVLPDEAKILASTHADVDGSHLNEESPFSYGQVEGDTITCAQVVIWLKESKSVPTQQAVKHALAPSTQQKHRQLLNAIQQVPEKYHSQLLPQALARWATDQQRTRRWQRSTMLTRLAALQGALRLSPMYRDTMPSIKLKDSLYWKLVMRAATSAAVAEIPRQPQAATMEEIDKLLHQKAKLNPLLEIAWMTAARVGDALKLSPNDVSFITNSDTQVMNVRFRRGKTATRSGQYTIAQPLPSPATIEYVNAANKENRLWLFPGITTADLTAYLRTANSQLESRSLRRGRLQYLSKLGYKDEELLHVSRHAGLPMLRRYLTFGSDSGENKRQAMRITELERKLEQPRGHSHTSKAHQQRHQARTPSSESSQTSISGSDTSIRYM